MEIQISPVTSDDIESVAVLQSRLLLANKGPENGFLVNHFTGEEYLNFVGRYEYFNKATIGNEIVGIMVAYLSNHIQPQDCSYSLLKYSLNKEFVLVKQIFISPDHAKKGVGTMLYNHLLQAKANDHPIVAVIVRKPFNEASTKFHKRIGFKEFLRFMPVPDKDGNTRLRSA